MKKFGLTFWMISVLILTACSAQPAATPEAIMATSTAGVMMGKTTPEAMMASPTPGAMMGKATPEAMMTSTTPDVMMATNWPDAALNNVNGNKPFKVSDFKGKVVVVEPMAVWCTTCLQQEKNIQTLLKSSDVQFVYISLDIDANENEKDLNQYASQNQFQWMLAVAPRNVVHEIGQLYGNMFLNPPSAPILIVDPQGKVHPLPFGVKSSDDIKKAIAQNTGM
jgi:cytochrome oxidase Cu insertion factor (SCO1/SenC/PrrC family)